MFWNFATEQWADTNYALDDLNEMAFDVAEAYLAQLKCDSDWFSHPWLPLQTQWKHHVFWTDVVYFSWAQQTIYRFKPICWFTFTRHGRMMQYAFLGSILWACQIGHGGHNLQVPSGFVRAGVCGAGAFNMKSAHVLAVAPLWFGMKPIHQNIKLHWT